MTIPQSSRRFFERLRNPDEDLLASLHAAVLVGPFLVAMPAAFGYLFREMFFYFWGENAVVRAFDFIALHFLIGLPYLVVLTFLVCQALQVYARVRLSKIRKGTAEAQHR